MRYHNSHTLIFQLLSIGYFILITEDMILLENQLAPMSVFPMCGFVCLLVVVGPWLPLAHLWVGMTLRLTGCEDSYKTANKLCGGLPPRVEITLARIWCQPRLSFWSISCEASWVGKLATVCWLWSLLRGALVKARFIFCLYWVWGC